MTREEAKQEVRRNWRPIIQGMTGRAKTSVNGEASYVCPLCGHGEHGDGLTFDPKSRDGNSLKCFGCGFSGDILDLHQQANGVDFNTALSLLAQEIGVTIENSPVQARQSNFIPEGYASTRQGEKTPQRAQERSQEANGVPVDYSEYIAECWNRIYEPDCVAYLESRGISADTAAAYFVGYDPAWRSPTAIQRGKNPPPSPRIILPSDSRTHYVARDTRSDMPEAAKTYRKMNEGKAGIFNERALYAQDVQEVFITEGAFDALAICETGKQALALNSTSNAPALIEKLKQKRTAATLILCLDGDDAGKKATETLKAGLDRLNISHVVADICGGHNDPNEALTADRAAFVEAVEKAIHQTAKKPDNTAYYIESLMTEEIDRFKAVKKTGFENLDRKSGGLNTGLYAIAAISSLGKTTFAAQMADQLAEAGHDILFFSLEQSKLELVSKSIARRTAQKNMSEAVTSLSIRRGYLPKQVREAAKEYAEAVGDRISIIEGNFSCNISFIGDYIRQYIRRTDTRPVVFVDYLQILQPEQNGNRQQTTREVVDATITELKRISREMDLTVFVISSVNRSNYLTPIDFESLKESGGIEYTCDCIWGLQLQCMSDDLFSKKESIKEKREKVKQAKRENPRKIELVCLKNRYGISSYSCGFEYYPANDLFVPDSDFEPEEDSTPRKAGRRI